MRILNDGIGIYEVNKKHSAFGMQQTFCRLGSDAQILNEGQCLMASNGVPCTILLTALMSATSSLGYSQAVEPAALKSPSATEGLDEVVVTAERRSETVGTVPMSITAISSATIEKFDIQDFADYAKEAPNVSFGLGVGAGGATFGAGVAGNLAACLT